MGHQADLLFYWNYKYRFDSTYTLFNKMKHFFIIDIKKRNDISPFFTCAHIKVKADNIGGVVLVWHGLIHNLIKLKLLEII